MKLSDNLKRIRKENNLSQEQLAEKLGVSRQAVSKWESDQSYPEMDKVLLICKLFNFNIDELMNENVKEVNETKQSKINFNKYIDDFFTFITKTVDMLGIMTFKQKLKCFIEQILVIIFILCVLAIIYAMGAAVYSTMFGILPRVVYYPVGSVLNSIFLILALIVGLTTYLHIFKIRYLDYYEIVKENDNQEKIEENTISIEKEKVFVEKKKEKVIIRDPEHSSSKFLNGIMKLVLWFIKFLVALFALSFVFTFVGVIALFILSFMFIKTGIIFWGSLLGIISAIIIHLIIFELCYNFIISKKNKKTRMAISFLIAMVLAGISIGLICIGITEFDYISSSEEYNDLEDSYTTKMTENLSIFGWNSYIDYVETDTDDVTVVVKYSKFYNFKIRESDEAIYITSRNDDSTVMDIVREIIKEINNKKIIDHYSPTIFVYASKDNIEKLIQNEHDKYEQARFDELNSIIDDQNRTIVELRDELYQQDIEAIENEEILETTEPRVYYNMENE